MSVLVTGPAAPTPRRDARALDIERVPPVARWDWWLAGLVLVQMAFGLLMILSASSLSADARFGNPAHFATRQVAGLALGLVLGAGIIRARWSVLSAAALPTYFVALAGLLLVLTPLSHSANGATRWISIAGLNFQPSEFAKLALIFALANFLARNEGRLNDFAVVFLSLAVPTPLLLLVILQPDFGTTVILSALTGVMVFLAGLRWRHVISIGGAGFTGLVLIAMLEPYRVRRFVTFFDPFADTAGSGYQVIQGWIALASGGWSGRGITGGFAQSGFLPEAHTDFISAVVGEEFGAVGFVLLVLSYALLVWRGTVIARRSADLFGTLLAMGITVLMGSQAIINLGVVVGVLPPKGLVLPFLSYGSSAALVHTLCVALLLRISMHRAPEARTR